MEVSGGQALVVAILVLFGGKYLNRKVRFLREFSIPEAVSGGLIASLVFTAFYALTNTAILFPTDSRDGFLVLFFTTIGLSSRFALLREGGRMLAILLVAAVGFLFVQNLVGVGVTSVGALNPYLGVLAGSVSLSGGHGTAIAWSPVFAEQYGVNGAMEIGVACATFGLVLGGVIGGPVARFLIRRNQLHGDPGKELLLGVDREKHGMINVDSMLSTILVISLAVGVGLNLQGLLQQAGIRVPDFVPCLFGGILLTNTVPYFAPRFDWPTGKPTLALISDLCLSLFLAMSLMSLQLWTLIDLALPIMLLLLAQVIAAVLFAVVFVYTLMGRNYAAAVMASGYVGLALGATPTAIANMTAVTKKFGPAPAAFVVVPLVGAFFIDIANAVVVNTVLGWLS
ncbi:Sodium/glutamate symporter [BD1-7 clade bacterium]|uniref:Sodium/glutamate symporter n=1 Tax=BD1-7 clade bacterium TaxID=2029982 RepID=A0A5S9N1V7_9GAMM|nr:Sodium/glutamate symporter [BD1-7 clade bacterium]CAA0083667.1 Sodium/glutamate symporter [BD1-7 clade bacterium]